MLFATVLEESGGQTSTYSGTQGYSFTNTTTSGRSINNSSLHLSKPQTIPKHHKKMLKTLMKISNISYIWEYVGDEREFPEPQKCNSCTV